MDDAKQPIEIPTLEYLMDMFKTEEDYVQYLTDHFDEIEPDSKNPIDCWVSHAFGWNVVYNISSLSTIEQIYREEYVPRMIENQSK